MRLRVIPITTDEAFEMLEEADQFIKVPPPDSDSIMDPGVHYGFFDPTPYIDEEQ